MGLARGISSDVIRIKHMCKINPRVDFAFKKLFGSEENKDLLMSLINAIVSEQEQVVEVELKNPYNLAD